MSKGGKSGKRTASQSPETPYWRELNEKEPLRRSRGGKCRCGKRPQKVKKPHGRKRSATDEELDETIASVKQSFAELSDPRVNRRRRHLLIDIVVIAICAVIAGAEAWKDMALWGRCHESWLKRLLALPNGIPSRDTFRRVISRLNPEEFQRCFLAWLRRLQRATDGQIVAIDGKTARRSKDGDVNPVHIVSAWAAEQHVTLGQTAVDSKSNEITAIPQLLRLLELKGALVTIDAMGCQTEIAAQIVKQQGDYYLAVKGNQEHLHEDLQSHFNACLENDFANVEHQTEETHEKAHGRIEHRLYYATEVPKSLRNPKRWAGLKSVGLVITERIVGGRSEVAVRYYIGSLAPDAKRFAAATRKHWGIENSLHWIMDVTFQEDQCRIRKDHGAENFSWLRRFAITLLKKETTVKDTIRAKRRRAMWSINYLESVLLAAIHAD